MLCRNVADQLLNQYRLTDSGTSEETDLTALCIRCQKIDDLNTGLKHLNDRALVFKRWRISVNHPVFLTVKAFASVECISEHVKQSAQGLISNRNLDTAALGNNLHILA